MSDTPMDEDAVQPPAHGGGEAVHEADSAPDQPGGLEPKLLRKALKKRVLYIEKHMETLSMKQLRRLLEQDLALVAAQLDGPPHKEYISSKVEEVVKLLLQKQKEDALAAQGAAHKPKLGASARGQQLKALLKAATVTVPPQAYTKAAGDEAAFCTLLEELLAKDGLSAASTPADCEAVKKRKLLARELEGIDAANIVEGRQRRGGEEAFHHPVAHAAPLAPPRLPGHHKPAPPVLGLAAKKQKTQGVKDWADDDD